MEQRGESYITHAKTKSMNSKNNIKEQIFIRSFNLPFRKAILFLTFSHYPHTYKEWSRVSLSIVERILFLVKVGVLAMVWSVVASYLYAKLLSGTSVASYFLYPSSVLFLILFVFLILLLVPISFLRGKK